MIDHQAIIDEGSRWLREHAGPFQTWEEKALVFLDERDRRERGSDPQIPDYAYDHLERQFGRYSRERLEGRGARREAAMLESAARQEAQARFTNLIREPEAVAALERLVAREIEAERERLSALKVVV
jgi:phosphoglucomutase